MRTILDFWVLAKKENPQITSPCDCSDNGNCNGSDKNHFENGRNDGGDSRGGERQELRSRVHVQFAARLLRVESVVYLRKCDT